MNNKLIVNFLIPQRAATCGQICAIYDNEICLGGGEISSIGPNYYEMNKILPSIYNL